MDENEVDAIKYVAVGLVLLALILSFNDISKKYLTALESKSAMENGYTQKLVNNKVIWIKQ